MLYNSRIMKHVKGLDTIRFIAAIWVVFGHFRPVSLDLYIDKSNWLGKSIVGVNNNLFCGPAAVIVFFLISGFCIHYPYSQTAKFEIIPFYLRRYIRIGLPLIIAVLLAKPMNVELSLFKKTILWSLFAELFYYTLYPIFRLLRKWIAWENTIAMAFTLSFLVILSDIGAKDYPSYGTTLNWLLGLPCWLLGCHLAETALSTQISRISFSQIIVWRTGIWAASILCSILRFHSPIGYPWTLTIFSIGVYYWLIREIHWFKEKPNKLWEWTGRWSYSLYLIHCIAVAFFSKYCKLSEYGYFLSQFVMISLILVSSYMFYLVVEKPGHFIGRFVSNSAKKVFAPRSVFP